MLGLEKLVGCRFLQKAHFCELTTDMLDIFFGKAGEGIIKIDVIGWFFCTHG
jgi:hypothetical protein